MKIFTQLDKVRLIGLFLISYHVCYIFNQLSEFEAIIDKRLGDLHSLQN